MFKEKLCPPSSLYSTMWISLCYIELFNTLETKEAFTTLKVCFLRPISLCTKHSPYVAYRPITKITHDSSVLTSYCTSVHNRAWSYHHHNITTTTANIYLNIALANQTRPPKIFVTILQQSSTTSKIRLELGL